jgi:predicted small lipoprotein YifL
MNRRTLAVLSLLSLAAALAACGTKGPLVLPDKSAAKKTAPPAPPPAQPAAQPQTTPQP